MGPQLWAQSWGGAPRRGSFSLVTMGKPPRWSRAPWGGVRCAARPGRRRGWLWAAQPTDRQATPGKPQSLAEITRLLTACNCRRGAAENKIRSSVFGGSVCRLVLMVQTWLRRSRRHHLRALSLARRWLVGGDSMRPTARPTLASPHGRLASLAAPCPASSQSSRRIRRMARPLATAIRTAIRTEISTAISMDINMAIATRPTRSRRCIRACFLTSTALPRLRMPCRA